MQLNKAHAIAINNLIKTIMKPILSEKDFQIIHDLIKNPSAIQQTKEIRYLAEELKKAKIVKNNKIGNDIVQLNSVVQIEDQVNHNLMDFKIVLPSEANLKEKKISILAVSYTHLTLPTILRV